ncbi:aminotransferase yhxA [Lysinibacillus sp. 54212]|uniref:aminotransferase yhxA n=1 Tax=Lysinibacillus sp. 54212 TaxID=3119829 RepID=UPI002FC75704
MGKTQKIMIGVTTTALTLGLTGCGSSTAELPPQPTDQECRDWDWDDDDGVWVCDDSTSTYRGHYFFGGRYYKDKNSLLKSSDYMSYKNGSSFKGGSQTSSGFGSGSKSYGG